MYSKTILSSLSSCAAVGVRSSVVFVSRSKARLRELGGNVTVCETASTGSSGERVACVLDIGAAVAAVVATIAEEES